MGETEDFFRVLLGDAPSELYAGLWPLVSKRSTWSRLDSGTDELAALALELATDSDVYVSVALVDEPTAPERRVSADLAAGIPALWADVDIATPDVHKKFNLPANESEARSVLSAAGLEPSILVHSGHGLQAWWLFDEFWAFEDEDQRLTAAQLSMDWNATLRLRAAEHDWTVDSTFDLARVMRIPGTTNRKGDPHLPVHLLELDAKRRYSASDFTEHFVDESLMRDMGISPVREYVVGYLKLNPGAEPPFDKFHALLEAEPYFKSSWDRRRRDFGDQSPSSYDLSLASYAAMADWSDQEIVDLLISSRRRHHDDLKLRADYYRRTLAKARSTVQRELAIERMDEVHDDLRVAKRSGDEEEVRDKRRDVLESVSQQLGIEVVRVVKHRSTPPSYRLELPTGGVDLGTSNDVISWSNMRAKIAAETNQLIGRFKNTAWDRLVQLIFEVCEEQDIGIESTESGQMYLWISEYLSVREPVEDESQALITEYPFVDDDGSVMIFGPSFRRWLWLNKGDRPTPRDFGRMMRSYGCQPVRLNIVQDGKRNTRSAWRVPPGRTTYEEGG